MEAQAEVKAAAERKAAAEVKAAEERKAAAEVKAAEERKAAAEVKAAEERKAAKAAKAAAEKAAAQLKAEHGSPSPSPAGHDPNQKKRKADDPSSVKSAKKHPKKKTSKE